MASRPVRTLLHNWRLKLAALGLSVFLWGLVQTEPRNQETFSSIPVIVTVMDTAWTLAVPPDPAQVELRLGGPAREIIHLAREGTTVRIPLEAINSPDTLVELRREWVGLGEGRGLTVESVLPGNVRISLERAMTRTLPIALRTRGDFPANMALASPLGLNPMQARVRGPRSRVEGLDSIPLSPFDLAAVEASGVFNVALDTTGLMGALLVPATATVGVRLESVVERVLDGLPVMVDMAHVGTAVVVDPVSIQIRVTGARSLVTTIEPGLLRVWVRAELLAGMAPGEERRVPLLVEGVPDLVTAVPTTDVVTVRRASDVGGGGDAGGR
jgi:hypothetical protein